MKVPATDFGGDTGVVREKCGRCGKPLGLIKGGVAVPAWEGKKDRYCSNACLMKAEPPGVDEDDETENQVEEEEENEMTTTATVDIEDEEMIETEEEAPITGKTKAKPAKKAAPKKGKVKAEEEGAAPAKKPKKAAADKASNNGDGPFRAGTTMAKVFDLLKDGKVHTRAQVNKVVEKAGKTPSLLYMFLTKQLPKRGFKVVQNDSDGIQISAKKK